MKRKREREKKKLRERERERERKRELFQEERKKVFSLKGGKSECLLAWLGNSA